MQKHDGEILYQCLTELDLSKCDVCDVSSKAPFLWALKNLMSNTMSHVGKNLVDHV